MAISSKIPFFLFLLTLSTSHARESQFFNKIPSNTNNVAVENQPKQEDPLNIPDQEPNFIPENENGGYGLYGHESGQLPTATTNPTTTNTNLPYNNQPNKYLPKNYNTESYVTEAEGYNPAYETKFTEQKQSYPAATTTTTTNPTATNTNLPYNNQPNSYLPKNYNTESYVTEAEGYNPVYETKFTEQKQNYPATTIPTTTNTNLPYNSYLPGENYNSESDVTESEGYNPVYETNYSEQKQTYPAAVNGQYYDQNSYNVNQQDANDFKLGQASYKTNVVNNYNSANSNPVQKQGMSDTRFLEHGKYFHDNSLEKNNGYPFQNTQGFDEQYSKNGGYYGSGYENFSNDEIEN